MRTSALIFTMCLAQFVFSQIPNSSFEIWETENTWEIPTDWSTNNARDFISVTRVDNLTDGDFAMKVETRGVSFEGFAPGTAYNVSKPISSFNRLDISYQIDSIEGLGNIEIVVSQYDGSIFQEIGIWESSSVTSGIEFLQLFVAPINMDSVKLEIRANSILTPVGYDGHAEIIVDELGFGFTTSTTEESLEKIKVYPNPTEGNVYFDASLNGSEYELYNRNGVKVKCGEFKDNILIIREEGEYLLRINNKDKWIFRKILVKH